MLAVFDVEPIDERTYRGTSDAGERLVVDGSQVLAQAIVAAAKACPGKSVRSAHAVLSKSIAVDQPLTFDIDVVHAGRLLATVVITMRQGDRRCVTTTVLLDQPQTDVVRHAPALPSTAGTPADAIEHTMPLAGRTLRLVDVVDPNDPDEVGPPRLHAWLRYDEVPERDELVKALLAHFTGHLGISTTLRAHAGVGTAQSHDTLSTAPITIAISFHEPVRWPHGGWLLYDHESVQVGAGMSHVRGQIFTEGGALLASFTQDAMIRRFTDAEKAIADAARL
jgi:acyl-CoA thioesterase